MNTPSGRPPRAGVLGRMTQGLALAQPPRISIRAQRFSLVDSGGNEMLCNLIDQQVGYYLDIVIVDANENKSKIFFGRNYDPNNDDPPLCWSDNGVGPSVSANTPQSPTCASCPNNVVGSATSNISGKPIKACQDRKKLAVLVIGDPHKSMYQIPISPGSLRNLSTYAGFIAKHPNRDNTGSADVADVVTRLSFDPQNQGVLNFMALTAVDAAMAAIAKDIYETGAADAIVGRTDTPVQGLLPAPQQSATVHHLPPPQQPPQGGFGQQAAPPATYTPPPAPQPQHQGNGAFASQPPASQPAQQRAPSNRGGSRKGAGRPPANAAPQEPAGAFAQSQAPAQGGQAFGAAPAQQPVSQPAPQQPPPTVHTLPADGSIPPFLQRAATPVAQPPAQPPAGGMQPTGHPPAPQFGMQPVGAPPANPDMSQALDRAFGVPVPRQ